MTMVYSKIKSTSTVKSDEYIQKEIELDESPVDVNYKFKLKDRGTIESSKAQFK